MGNALAVAAVTETLSRIVETAAQAAVSAARVTNAPPEAPPSSAPTQVSVYLYHVSESPHFRANDLPTRDNRGAILTKPQIGLELEYLISFYGASDQLEPELMLGSVLSVIHARPLLTPAAIDSAIASRVLSEPGHPLAQSDLSQQVEGVRVTPAELDLEEMSKLWSVFFQEPYALSVAYRVSIVLIEVDETPVAGLPVQVRQVKAVASAAPFIGAVTPAAVSHAVTGAVLTLHGTSLASDQTIVTFGAIQAAPQLVTNQKIVVPIPANLPAGVRAVHVTHMVEWGTPDSPDPRPIMESNRVAFAYQPEVSSAPVTVASAATLTLSMNPEVKAEQRVRLVLRETATSAAGQPPQSFEVEQIMAAADHRVEFVMDGAPLGDFWLRIAVDDVTSALESDETGFTGPILEVT